MNGREGVFQYEATTGGDPNQIAVQNAFHNQPIPNNHEILYADRQPGMALIVVDRGDADTAEEMLDVIAHESMAHGTGAETRGHFDGYYWGVAEFRLDYEKFYPRDSEAFRFRQEADVLLRVRNITRVLFMNAAGKIMTRQMVDQSIRNLLPRHR